MKLLFGALKSHIPALIPPGTLLHAPPGPDLGAELVELAALVAGDDELAERAPHGAGDLGIAAGNLHVGLVVLCGKKGSDTPPLRDGSSIPHSPPL